MHNTTKSTITLIVVIKDSQGRYYTGYGYDEDERWNANRKRACEYSSVDEAVEEMQKARKRYDEDEGSEMIPDGHFTLEHSVQVSTEYL